MFKNLIQNFYNPLFWKNPSKKIIRMTKINIFLFSFFWLCPTIILIIPFAFTNLPEWLIVIVFLLIFIFFISICALFAWYINLKWKKEQKPNNFHKQLLEIEKEGKLSRKQIWEKLDRNIWMA